jgi:hypothetical protein
MHGYRVGLSMRHMVSNEPPIFCDEQNLIPAIMRMKNKITRGSEQYITIEPCEMMVGGEDYMALIGQWGKGKDE